jgi:hypothetical protein
MVTCCLSSRSQAEFEMALATSNRCPDTEARMKRGGDGHFPRSRREGEKVIRWESGKREERIQ